MLRAIVGGNYTRNFAYLWEEIIIPVRFQDDRSRVEQIMIEAARQHALDPQDIAVKQRTYLQEHLGVEPADFQPRVFYRITDN